MKMLGSFISGDASDEFDRSHACGNIMKAFRGNRVLGLQDQAPHRRLHFLRSLVSQLRYKWKQWPFSGAKAGGFDSLQKKLTRFTFPEAWRDDDSYASFKGREGNRVKELCEKQGYWSKDWAKAAMGDSEHLARGNDKGLWAPYILRECRSFVDNMREWVFRATGTMLETRMGTRVIQGPPRTRVWQGHLLARAFLDEGTGSIFDTFMDIFV